MVVLGGWGAFSHEPGTPVGHILSSLVPRCELLSEPLEVASGARRAAEPSSRPSVLITQNVFVD